MAARAAATVWRPTSMSDTHRRPIAGETVRVPATVSRTVIGREHPGAVR